MLSSTARKVDILAFAYLAYYFVCRQQSKKGEIIMDDSDIPNERTGKTSGIIKSLTDEVSLDAEGN